MVKHNRTQAVVPSAELDRNVDAIMALERHVQRKRSLGERVAARLTAIAGSTPCILVHLLGFSLWILANTGMIPQVAPFDPFPFVFLTLVVSLEAIVLTLLVLMSQKRLLKEADTRAHLDLQINLLAEQESTMTLRMVRRLCDHFGMDVAEDENIEQLAEATNVKHVAKKLEKKLPS